MIELYDDQREMIRRLREVYKAGARAPILVAPTGSGKTVLVAYCCYRAILRGTRILIVVHRNELVDQMSTALGHWHVQHGLIVSDAPETPQYVVQVAMVQTLVNRIRRCPDPSRYQFDLVVIDECHHAIRRTGWGRVLEHNSGAKLLGVTATPCRLDGRGLGVTANGFFDALVIGPTVADLIEIGRLSRMRVFAGEAPDLQGVRKRGGDFVVDDLERACNTKVLTGNAVAEYRKRCGGSPAIAFTVTVAHAEAVCAAFQRGGFQSAVLTGMTPRPARERMLRDLSRGVLEVIVSCNVISEGTDIPAATAAILLRPTASFGLAMQQMGRALRVHPGKESAVILDHAGNVHRHGLPTDPVEWSLDDKPKREIQPMKMCPTCGVLVPQNASACENCGAEFVSRPRPKRSIIETNDELVEMLLDEAGRRQEVAEQAEAKTLDQLRDLAKKRGYKPGWAWHVLQARKRRESGIIVGRNPE